MFSVSILSSVCLKTLCPGYSPSSTLGGAGFGLGTWVWWPWTELCHGELGRERQRAGGWTLCLGHSCSGIWNFLGFCILGTFLLWWCFGMHCPSAGAKAKKQEVTAFSEKQKQEGKAKQSLSVFKSFIWFLCITLWTITLFQQICRAVMNTTY